MRKQFGDRLKELRLERDMTQQELADIFNTGKASISHYESNRRMPDANNIERFAEFFNTTTDYILGKSDNKTPESQGVKLAKQQDFEFDNPEDALKFILGQPAMMDYGGYDLSTMPEEEVLEIANDILLTLRISIERRKNKAKGE